MTGAFGYWPITWTGFVRRLSGSGGSPRRSGSNGLMNAVVMFKTLAPSGEFQIVLGGQAQAYAILAAATQTNGMRQLEGTW